MKMLILSALAVTCSLGAFAAKTKGVFVNSDTWNLWYLCEALKSEMATMDRDQLIAAINADVDAYARRGAVEAVFYNMNFQRSFYPTKVGTPIWKDCEIKTVGEGTNVVEKLFLRGKEVSKKHAAGFIRMIRRAKRMNELLPEFMELRYRRCHEKGVEMWHSMRMNDVHNTGIGEEDIPQHCDLWVNRKDLLRAWYRHFERTIREDNCLDYGQKEVYDYHLAMVREYLMDYVSDGLELDWGRSGPVFKPGFDEMNTPILTQFMRDVRKIADEAAKKWGHPMRIAVRIPNRVNDALGQGMDIATWAKEKLVDVIMPTSHHHSPEQQCEVALYRIIAPDVILAPCLDCTAGSGHSLFYGADPQHYDVGFASAWYQQGADTMYFYNHFSPYFIDYPEADVGLWLSADRDRAAKAARRHIYTSHDPNGEGKFEEACYPAQIWKNSSNGGIKINCGEQVAGRKAVVIFGLKKGTPFTATIRVNTEKCPPLAPSARPLPKLPKPEKTDYYQYEIPVGVLHDGWNVVEVFNLESRTLVASDFVWTEVDVDACPGSAGLGK